MPAKFRIPVIVLATLLGGAEVLSAQLCTLGPAVAGRQSVGLSVGFAEFSVGYGAGLEVNPEGPLGFGMGISRASARQGDGSTSGISGSVGYEMTVAGARVCPSAALGYSSTGGTDVLNVSSYSAAASLDIAVAMLEVGPVEITPIVAPGYSLALLTFEDETLGHTSTGEFQLSAESLLRLGRWWGSGGVTIRETGDPSFGFGVGFLF